MVEMTLQGINHCPRSGQPVLLIQEKGGERLVRIGLSREDASIISAEITGTRTRRSEAYTLLISALGGLGGKITAVVLHIAQERQVQSCLRVDGKEGPVQIAAHPVDALAIAVREGSPVYMSVETLASASVSGSSRGDCGPDGPSRQDIVHADVDGGEYAGLPSAFRGFLATLDLSGLGTDG
ncbi:MAG: bifunctional nuclease family protein [Chloroflexi bacterium]|nr:bifunctional nuclease family protein [Chloroflexota bacterium]